MATTKNSVIINGVTLTRAQVEAALAELNTPAPTVHRVRFDDTSGAIGAKNVDVHMDTIRWRTDGAEARRGIYLPNNAYSSGYSYPITWSIIRDDIGCSVLIGEYTR